jgi:NAD(P)-dependent dehydrogenase (short-subunit alcohol dehydrogenase family)
MTGMVEPVRTAIGLAGRRVWVAGHRGMVGSALCRRLAAEYCEIITAGRAELDLTDQAATLAWMERARPEIVFSPRPGSEALSPMRHIRRTFSTTT